ncbi:uncharacterized protein LOC129568837 isoform X2 [Sitodiplosis mosellana]|uniref:uncharacterized protein LOC129568837 isoform X2 n=1 Tax=Sitodiplosis mosellana TaxID=263140 RepID=UPI002443834E|nr:uncharacterized protein LOC129568837 isoform X2 [Sitodiplosis mosellana]
MVVMMGDDEILCKKQRLTKENSTDADESKSEITSASSKELASKIFKLNADCFDEIFEYLSLKDLHSFSQTCRALQKVSGEYYKLNWRAAEKFIGNDGIYTIYTNDKSVIKTQTSGFNQFTQFLSLHYEDFEPFRYIKTHADEFIRVNHLYLVCVGLNSAKMTYFEGILPQIETVQIRQCTIWNGDFYEIILQHCEHKLKRLYVQDDLGDIINRMHNPWLLRKYPSLEHLELTPRYSYEIVELGQFFDLNPNIRSFSIGSHCLWMNRKQLMDSGIKLDLLEVKHFDSGFYFYHVEKLSIPSICTILNQLFERGLYKRLHLSVIDIDKESIDQMASIQGLERLSVKEANGMTAQILSNLKNLKELSIMDCSNTDWDEVAGNLTKLEKLFIQNATYDDMLAFIRRSSQLKLIKVFPRDKEHFNGGVMDLVKLNEVRKKLPNARKLIIYIEDNIFLPTKWNTDNGDTNLSYIEMKRSKSLCWDYDCSTFKTIH